MATSKLNIFNALPQHASDSEDDDFHKTKGKKVGQKEGTRTDDKSKNVKKTGASGSTVPAKQEKEEHARAKEPRKDKGVSEKAHPLDRHSGTGVSAYGGKPKKGGAGKGNWGKTTEEKAGEEAAPGEEETEQVVEEEKPEGITLQEYYSSQRVATNKPQINEAKAKITSEQLIKELGKSTLLKSKNAQQVDDHKVGKKKDHLDVNHKAGLSTEHGDLLGFRTGFIEKEYRARVEGEQPQDRRRAPRTENRGEKENAKEEETKPTTTETAEGEQTTEGKTEEKQEGQQNKRRYEGQREGQRGGRGGYKGDRPQGDRPHGDRPHGDRPHGDRPHGDRPRKNYGGPKTEQTKINFEDESAFPKLG